MTVSMIGCAERPYAVCIAKLAEACTCPDFERGRAPEFKGSRWCKHLLSALLLAHLAKRQPAPPVGPSRTVRVRLFRSCQTRRPARAAKVA